MTDAEKKEIRSQRHDFIKEYYKMATTDLDRHLKAGWQTIAILAAGAAILTAGHDGKMELPIATAIALASAYWGMLTVLDANYWSLRAIGFLANVEAVYFTIEDRKYFNPYAGEHPPYKLLDSLRYMFWLCLLFGFFALFALVLEISNAQPNANGAWQWFVALKPVPFLGWALPFLVAIGGALWAFRVWIKRMKDYLGFAEGSPGPGMLRQNSALRDVTFQKIEPQSAAVDHNVQNRVVTELKTRLRRLQQRQLPLELAMGVVVLLTVLSFIGRM